MSGNSTSLYSTSTSNITLSSNNLTTLYPGGSGTVTPAQPYGNANVVGLLAAGTDGANTVANIVATGNITGNYFIGNGSQLTGVVAVSANTANTAVTVTGNAQPNITSVGTLTSLSSTGNVTGGNLRTAGAVSAIGNVTGNYFLGNGSQLTGLPATYSNANVVSLMANFGSNTISTTGNITGGFILGNGSQLTGLPATYSNANVTSLLANFGSNAISTTGNITAGNVIAGAVSTPTVYSQGMATQGYDYVQMQYSNSVALPVTPYDIGTGSWFYLDAGGGVFQSNTTGTLQTVVQGNDGSVSATGNITAPYYFGNGSQLTGLPATYSNANVTSLLANFGSNTISTTGNITAGYVVGNGSLLTSITGANVTGSVAQANTANTANAVAGANVTGQVANALVAGTVYTNAQPNITSLGTLSSVTVTGNITGGNLLTTGVVSATGNITTQGFFIGNFQGNITGNLTVPGSNTEVIYNNSGNAGASSGFTFNQASNVVTVAGNIASGNISTTGNVTGNYVIGNGSLLSDITGGNVTGSVAQANQANTANAVAGANVSGQVANALVAGTVYTNAQPNITSVGTLTSLSTSGNISAAGNIQGNVFIGNGAGLTNIPGGNIVGGYGNANVSNFLATGFGSNTISTTGNISAGNILLGDLVGAGNVTATGNITGGLFTGNGSGLSSITGANVTGTVANATFATTAGSAGTANTAVTVTGNAQANITSLGILTSLSVSGNTTSGNVLTSVVQATNSAGLSLKNASGTTQASMGAGGGDNFAINVSTNLNGNNAQIDISPTGTGHVHIKPTGTGAVEIAPTSTGSINNMIIGNITPAAVSATTVSATGNITGNYFIGNGSQLTGLPAGYSNADVATFLANFGSNSISTTGNVTASYFTGNGSLLSSITGANVTGTVANATYALNANAATYADQANYANIANSVSGSNVSGQVANALVAGTVYTAAQPNITSVGTLTSVAVTGNATAGNLLAGGVVSATGNVTGNYFIGNGSQLTGIVASSNAAGSNTQIQYNNANAFAGNAGLTFNQTTGNVALANLVVSPGVAGNANAGNNAVIINTATPFNGISATATGLQAGQTVYGTGNYGNLAVGGLLFSTPKGARNLFWDSANVSDGSNVGVRYGGLAVPSTVTLQGNLTSNNNFIRAFITTLQVGGGASANTFTNVGQGGQALGAAAFATTIGEGPGTVTPRVGNTTVRDTVSLNSQITVWNGSNVSNAVSAVYNFTNSTGNITNALGVVTQFSGTVNTTPTNVVGYYMPTNTGSLAGFNSANAMRAATNYYFLKNDDAVAQTQLGSLRSYNEFRYDTATTGNITLDKNNAQVQYIAPTANVTIDGYANMVTSLSDSVNTDQEIDTLTILVQQGATPYTVTLPTGATYQYAGNISTVPAVANSRSILTVVAANVSGTVNYFTTVQSDQAVVSSYGDANVATFLAAFGSNTISTTGTVTAGNVTGGNILTGGIMSATGNVTGNYILGNGSQLTGITATANAAGSNTQIQYNNAGAFAGSANLTFDNTTNTLATTTVTATANINGAALSITGNTTGSNIFSYPTANGVIVNSTVASNVNATINPYRIVYGNGFRGDYGANADPANFNRGSLFAAIGTQVLANADTTNSSRLLTSSYFMDLNQGANITNTNKRYSAGGFYSQIGNGNITLTAASGTNMGAVLNGGTQTLLIGNSANANLGAVSVSHAAALNSTFIASTGGTVGNATGALITLQTAAANASFTTSQIGYTAQFLGTTGTPAGNVIGYYMPSNVTTNYGFNSTNLNRAATNYYFLKNDDDVAQNQLGSLRAYHTFQATGTTTGTWNIDKANGQVQAISTTGNVTIGSYTNFVTTANDGTNNDSQTDTVTLIIEQGATPYTVTMPTGNAAIRYAGNVSTVANTANSTTMIAIVAYRTAANATSYLTTISPGFV